MLERLNVKVEEFKGKSKNGNDYVAIDIKFINRSGEEYSKRVFLNNQELTILKLMNK